MLTLHNEFKEKIKAITEYSKKVNGDDKRKILKMMAEHIDEIKELYNQQNDHWAIETADLIVLSYELLLLENKDIDTIFSKCLPRFEAKLKQLAEKTSPY